MKLNLTKIESEELEVKDLSCFDFLKKGGEIKINPKNKGKFTETKKRTGKSTEELTHSKNKLTKKRAVFAQNAKKWKHEDGGKIKSLPEVTVSAKRSNLFIGNHTYEGYVKGKRYSGTKEELSKALGENWKDMADKDGGFEVTKSNYTDRFKKDVVNDPIERQKRLIEYKK